MHSNNFSQYTNGKILELREALLKQKHSLWDLLDEYYYITNIVYSQIMYEYEMIFGEIEEEIEEKDRLARELSSKIEFTNRKQNFSKSNVTNSFSQQNNPNPNTEYIPNCNVNIKYEVTQLYRQLAKKLHPDLAGDTYEFRRFWHNIQDSYKQFDVQRLRMFYQTIVSDDIDAENENRRREEIALRTEIQDIQFNINKLKNRIANLKTQEPYVFKDKMNDRLWIVNRKQKLMLKLFHIDVEIINHQSKLRNLSGKYQSVS